jgi:hypothetical protein
MTFLHFTGESEMEAVIGAMPSCACRTVREFWQFKGRPQAVSGIMPPSGSNLTLPIDSEISVPLVFSYYLASFATFHGL